MEPSEGIPLTSAEDRQKVTPLPDPFVNHRRYLGYLAVFSTSCLFMVLGVISLVGRSTPGHALRPTIIQPASVIQMNIGGIEDRIIDFSCQLVNISFMDKWFESGIEFEVTHHGCRMYCGHMGCSATMVHGTEAKKHIRSSMDDLDEWTGDDLPEQLWSLHPTVNCRAYVGDQYYDDDVGDYTLRSKTSVKREDCDGLINQVRRHHLTTYVGGLTDRTSVDEVEASLVAYPPSLRKRLMDNYVQAGIVCSSPPKSCESRCGGGETQQLTKFDIFTCPVEGGCSEQGQVSWDWASCNEVDNKKVSKMMLAKWEIIPHVHHYLVVFEIGGTLYTAQLVQCKASGFIRVECRGYRDDDMKPKMYLDPPYPVDDKIDFRTKFNNEAVHVNLQVSDLGSMACKHVYDCKKQGARNYDLITNNCQHFACALMTSAGLSCSLEKGSHEVEVEMSGCLKPKDQGFWGLLDSGVEALSDLTPDEWKSWATSKSPGSSMC